MGRLGQIVNLGVYTTARVFSDLGVTQVGSVPKGARVEILRVDGKWAAFRLMVGNTALCKPRTTTPAEFWVAAETIVYDDQPPPPPPPPPPPQGNTVIGIHPALPALLPHQRMGVHLLGLGKPEMDVYLNAGCKSFTSLNNVNAAREARATGAAVIYRHYMDHGILEDPRQFVLRMGLQSSDRLMIMGINEGDNIGVDEIRRRFEWDRKFAEAVWELLPNCFPVLGSFSMGTPRIEDPGVAREFRETYGAFLNANWHRVGLNYHSYSARPASHYPPSTGTVIAPRWLEMRHLLFGYDPLLGGLDKRVVLVSDESGVDIGGIGGFPDCQYDDPKFLMWAADRLGLFAAHPQMYVFNLFQGDARIDRWRGYLVLYLLGAMSRVWRGEVRPTNNLAEVATRLLGPAGSGAGDVASPLGMDWSPAPKVLGGE